MGIVSIRWASLKNPNKQPSLQDATGPVPVFPVPIFNSATTSSYSVGISGYDSQFTYSASSSNGVTTRTNQNVTVSGLSANQSSFVIITASNIIREISFTASAEFLSLAATPTLTQTGQTTSSITVTIGNYDSSLTYTIGSSSGSATRVGNIITVTGLGIGETVIVTATASNSSGNSAEGTVSAISEIPLPTGGTITTSGGYRYHTFNSSGALTVPITRTVEYLVVAGGGGGGDSATYGGGEGGGGAGGLRTASVSLPAQSYTITIGAGGTRKTSGAASSIVGVVSSTGGGNGAGVNNIPFAWVYAGPGGSGGGGSGQGPSRSSGSGTPGQGYPGGSGSNSPAAYAGGGGGGAGGSGGNATSFTNPGSIGATGGNGGSGITVWGSGYGGGGGGNAIYASFTHGSGGYGGGAPARQSGAPLYGTPGTANTGGGGGSSVLFSGGETESFGGSGGSGVVVIRYPI